MKKILFCAVALGLMATAAHAKSEQERVMESRAAVKGFFGALKSQLVAGLEAGGPVNAIGTCNTAAPGIAAETSKKAGWSVARTSLKLRNQKNAPDAWEKAVLETFDKRRAAGEDPMQMEFSEVTTVDGKKAFRYMKAIPTAAKPCLACHGSKIKPEVIAKLDQLYPGDMARGYKPGDIRGAFTITQPIE
ncbi:MAG: DUF3365 domain-containing protein [Alphaproteobacteria bacterium]|nr:DUF3365 domain-containing protein [Rhodospirillales bacterium]MCW9045922.1 DUF3365 domain-containing protein [Alphaproteobacteria bacterium]